MTIAVNPSTSEALEAALRKAWRHAITPKELWQQRVSFAFGNVALSNPSITREMVEAQAVLMFGPCPE